MLNVHLLPRSQILTQWNLSFEQKNLALEYVETKRGLKGSHAIHISIFIRIVDRSNILSNMIETPLLIQTQIAITESQSKFNECQPDHEDRIYKNMCFL